MMRALFTSGLAGLLALSCGPDERRTLSPVIDITAVDGMETLPWVPGGKFPVKVKVPKPKAGRLCGPLNARAEITTPTLDTGAVTASNFALKQVGECESSEAHHEGLTELAWPAGGEFQVRVTLAGEEHVRDIRMDVPEVRVVRGEQTRQGAQLRVPLCVVSSAASGAVTLTVEGGTLDDGQAVRRVNLGPTPCDDQGALVDRARKRWATAVLFTTAERASVRVDLEGRANEVLPVVLLPDLRLLDLTVTPERATLPPPGSVFSVTVVSRIDGRIADGVPVRIETTPAAQVLPPMGITGTEGVFVAHIAVPEGAMSMRVEAVTGSVRRGETVPPSP